MHFKKISLKYFWKNYRITSWRIFPEIISGGIPEEILRGNAGGAPRGIPEGVPNGIPKEMPEGIQEIVPEEILKQFLEES